MSKSAIRKPRAWLALTFLVGIAVVLTIWNTSATAGQVALATGPPSLEQERYFVGLVDRPDLLTFFKSIPKWRRLQFARNIGRYPAPELAKLIGILLGDFDEDVRAELGRSLVSLAKTQPEAVSQELSNSGSFQLSAIFRALKALGLAAFPIVGKRLDESATRQNAKSFLVEAGPVAIPQLEISLQSSDPETRAAAADVLGKLRARSALPELNKLYDSSQGDYRNAYLVAISAIGDRRSEGLLLSALNDARVTLPMKEDAALGLGRIGDAKSLRKLTALLHDQDRELSSAALSALHLAGNPALEVKIPLADKLRIAEGIKTTKADALISSMLASADGRIALEAARAASGRRALCSSIYGALLKLDSANHGDIGAELANALVSTPEGRKLAANLPKDSLPSAFVERRLLLSGSL